MGYLKLATPLDHLKVVSPRYIKLLERLGLATVGDLLYHFPLRYEDFSVVSPISDIGPGQHVTVSGIIESVEVKRTWKRHIMLTEAVVADETGSVKTVWFNQPYLKTALRVGAHANFSGKVAAGDKEIYLSHPSFELVRKAGRELRHTGRLVPVYPETRGLTSRGIRTFVQTALEHLEPPEEWLPDEALRRHHFPALPAALRDIHFPASLNRAAQAKKRFAFEDLFLLCLANAQVRRALAKEEAPPLPCPPEEVRAILRCLPFRLTQSQERSLGEILQDVAGEKPMNRLLQGDVGSGKTIVAVIAALVAARNGFQTALLAPTEILARQHFESVKKVLSAVSGKDLPHYETAAAALISGSGGAAWQGTAVPAGRQEEAECSKRTLNAMIAEGRVSLVVGTHALIQKSVSFKNLGLLIVDEQHRFGVRQRAELLKRKEATLVPHLLSMSATPIPRTLMLTVFGDLDISLITELPAGRRPILTKIVAPENRAKAYGFIRAQIQRGRQAFVICPRIEPTNASEENARRNDSRSSGRPLTLAWEVKTVKEEYEKLSSRVFPDLRVAMLHGKLRAAEKEKTMREFKEREWDILVSTSVVEVGVDIPNATIMMIEGADRFGLAQLYQFRGRVGRGEHQSFCFLFTDSPYKSTRQRLEAVVRAKNGFELAEMDLKLRGPGEFLGTRQTGLPDIAMRGLQDMELIKASRESAAAVLTKDPYFENFPLLKEKLLEFQKKIHQE